MNKTTQANQPPRLAFLFTGHGAQYPGMGRGLYEQSAVFRQAIEECDEALRPYLDHPLPDVLYHPDLAPRLLDSMTYAQAGLFALEYGLARLWQSWGVWPTAVMGHSLGEYVAACVAGVFSLSDAAKLVAARSRLMDSVEETGQMAVIFAGEEVVAQAVAPLADDVAIAVINGPSNVVISGRQTAVQTIMARLKEERIRSRPIDVAQAAHSPLLNPVLPEFEAIAATVQYHDPTLALVSTVTGQMVEPGEVTNAVYWRRHLRLPVRFADAMQTLHAAGYTHFLEIGPQPTLLGMGKRCLPADTDAIQWLASLDKDKDDWQALAASATELGIEALFDDGR
jgi:acyl transferase domain-containing protein